MGGQSICVIRLSITRLALNIAIVTVVTTVTSVTIVTIVSIVIVPTPVAPLQPRPHLVSLVLPTSSSS